MMVGLLKGLSDLGLSDLIFAVAGLCRYGERFVGAMFLSRADSAVRIIALESQLDASMRQNSPERRYRFSRSFRFLWVILVSFWSAWETPCHAMKPRYVVVGGGKGFVEIGSAKLSDADGS